MRLTLLVKRVRPVGIDRDDRPARRAAAIRAREFWLASAVEDEIPHEAALSVVLDCPNEDVVHVPLDVRPPIAAVLARALGKVDLLVRVRRLERVLLAHRPAVAVERDARERVVGRFHLCFPRKRKGAVSNVRWRRWG